MLCASAPRCARRTHSLSTRGQVPAELERRGICAQRVTVICFGVPAAGSGLCCGTMNGARTGRSMATVRARRSFVSLCTRLLDVGARASRSLAGLRARMSRMSIADLKQRWGWRPGPISADALERDPRDARIEHLEQALAEEQQRSAELQGETNELKFRTEVLDKSYAKQLQDARQRAEQTEQSLTACRARLSELDELQGQAAKSIADTRSELECVTAERDRLRRALDPQYSPRSGTGRGSALAASVESISIDDMLEDALWVRERDRLAREGSGLAGQAVAPSDPTIGEMLAPDLMLQKANKSSDP
jgi:hypothetical protein